MKEIIVFKNVVKKYGQVDVFKDLSLSINKGELLTVIGSSGCGKTTLIKMINKIIEPDLGEIFFDGKNIKNIDIIELRRNIGYVIQNIGLFPHMNLLKNITYVLDLQKKDKVMSKKKAEELLDILSLPRNFLNRYPSELSGGQKQRVGIARALAANPEIILMDEPFGAVDEITRKSLQNELLKIHVELKKTFVFVTHDIKEALTIGTKVLVINKGKIEAFGSPSEIRSIKEGFIGELINI